MTRKIFNILAGTSLLFLLAGSPLFAQSVWMTAEIPFAFVVENRTLPAGEYQVRPEGRGFVLIKSTDGKENIFVLRRSMQSSTAQPHPRLVFHQYGETYFLSELWRGGTKDGQKLRMSAYERELAQSNAPLEVRSIVAQQR